MTTAEMGGYTRISGHDARGRTFDFRRTGNRVTGYYNENYVEFDAPQAANPAAIATR